MRITLSTEKLYTESEVEKIAEYVGHLKDISCKLGNIKEGNLKKENYTDREVLEKILNQAKNFKLTEIKQSNELYQQVQNLINAIYPKI